jgi:geranylgeranyl diphosphate synthase type II
MDNDDFRRGKPTLHKKYGDAIAVLAGDALHALAFELLASVGNPSVLYEVSKAIGIFGMLGGQVADVEAEGREITPSEIEYIHRHKTGALIEVSLKIGAMLAGADDEKLSIFSSYGSRIGLAFQIIDDILDVTGSTEKLGKDAGSDERNIKATYPRAIGLDKSREIAEDLIRSAIDEIDRIGPHSAVFKYLADFIFSREH